MAADSSVRSLSGLEGASSNRVLNLIAISEANLENEKHKTAPMFVSKVLNRSLVLKHRLRADETDFFTTRRALVTKIIIPFERTDLKFGGRSLFVGQRGFEDLLQEVGNYTDKTDMKRDMDVLRLIDNVPSLDPFLLREHLRCNDIRPDSCYFAISPADQQRMHDYAAQEVSRLTALANGAGPRNAATSRMVAALLSSEVNEKLEPLRATLCLGPAEFAEGVFSWRGFIYYKWCLDEYWPNLIRALRGIKAISPIGKVTLEERSILDASKNIILRGAKANSMEIRRIINIYDQAYAGLIERQDPKLFREFLLGAPELFLDIGDKMGAISHITSFWNYRFPQGAPRAAHSEELVTIFQDFTKGLMMDMELAA
ncbi:MAG TPA: hypothetical protein VFI23_07535 [Rhizomicrobium sp.]|nr:hypothetical protein [Rhizomicrobium sp.]